MWLENSTVLLSTQSEYITWSSYDLDDSSTILTEYSHWYYKTNTCNTHTRSTALCPGLSGWAGTRKVKPIWILLKQETVSGSGITWAICKSAPHSRQITMPAPHHSCFFTGRMPFLSPNQEHQSTVGTTITCNYYVIISITTSNRLALQKIKQLLFIREEINVSRSGSNNGLL